MAHFVYFIQSRKSKYIKIGYTDNPEQRIKALQTGSAEPLILLGFNEFDSKEKAMEMEQRTHEYLEDSRLEGEWFDFTLEVIEFLIQFEWFTPVLTNIQEVSRQLAQENKQLKKLYQEALACSSYAGA